MKMISLFMGLLACMACSRYEGQQDSNSVSSLQSTNCEKAQTHLRNAENFADLVQLINSLPKPLTTDCFLQNYDAPLKIHATNSTFSAQPAEGPGSPRVFIIKNNFIISVVPSNKSESLVEFSLVTAPNQSVKGELKFPILTAIDIEEPFLQIKSSFNGATGTDCRFCHFGEAQVGSNSFSSLMLAPDPFKHVSATYMVQETQKCDPNKEPQRCRILNALYGRGLSDVNWPF